MTDLKNFEFNLTLTFLSANKRLSWRGRQEIIDIEFYRGDNLRQHVENCGYKPS